MEDFILYHSESHFLDFKREQYPIANHPKKHELLKDISAMANHPEERDKYIIIGISENASSKEFHPIIDLADEAYYRQYINSNVEPTVNFEYKAFQYKGHQLAYFRIYNNNERPYLIKREVKHENKVLYREGDGFIRMGTSTRKLIREDLERIYTARYTNKDRKSDLLISTNVKKVTERKLSHHDLQYIDISIENMSNKSIAFDVEMKIFKANGYSIISESDCKKELKKREDASSRMPPLHFFNEVSVDVPNLYIDVSDFENYFLIKRTSFMQAKTAINLAQREIEHDIFCAYAIVLGNEPVTIKAEVIIRSDDFTSGVLSQQLEFRYIPLIDSIGF